MIGLGSNRLTCCRRGGMSVTQAGRGGMEWLAGGRKPSWASPYSVQATAALKAQFPTQWQTIRDYGFAHPALVPFINEDQMLVMSLIDGLGTRWLVGDGYAYINSGIVMKDLNYVFELDTQWDGTDAGQFATYFGFMGSVGSVPRLGLHNYTGKIMIGTNVTNTTSTSVDKNRWIYSYNASNGEVKRKSVGGTYSSIGSAGTDSTSFSTNTLPIYVFARNYNGFNNGMKAKISSWAVKKNGADFAKFVPFKRNNVAGMLDVIGLTVYEKQGSGSFTISETPAS